MQLFPVGVVEESPVLQGCFCGQDAHLGDGTLVVNELDEIF